MACLHFAGLLFVRSEDRVITPHQVYCYFISLFPFIGLAMELSLFRFTASIDFNLMMLVNCFCFTLHCAANAIASLIHSHNPKYVRKFFVGFDSLNIYGGQYTHMKKVNKLAKYTVIMSCSAYFLTVLLIGYAMCMTDLFIVILEGFILEPTNPIIKAILTIIVSVLELHWIFPKFIDLSFGILIVWEYCRFHEAFTKRMYANQRQLQESIENDRQRFVEMARIVEAADKILTLHHGACFACNIVNLCLIVYMIAYYSSSAQIGIIVLLLLLFTGDIAIVCVSGILINSVVSL